VVFFRDLIADRREKQRLAIELEQARAIQQILIPEGVAAVPGFHIQSVYEPHGEVGGDFFQILPLTGGGALIAIGDVSGKGLPAAMQVSLLVGTLRALADSMQSPATILTAANRHMIGRSNGGFTTCLVLRVDLGGAITAANAGHLPPYCNGIEVTLDNGLPLGLDAKASYEESPSCLPRRPSLLC
jgi:serine phosphatase RsbU (regulator of sigma subunit)